MSFSKATKKYIRQAQQIEKVNLTVSYYCRLYAVNNGMKVQGRTSAETGTLGDLLTWLEKNKTAKLADTDAALAQVSQLAMQIFGHADDEDRAGRGSKATALGFNAAATVIEVCQQFGALSAEMTGKLRYCRWKTADILRALKEGRRPLPGSLKEQQEEQELANELMSTSTEEGGQQQEGKQILDSNKHGAGPMSLQNAPIFDPTSEPISALPVAAPGTHAGSAPFSSTSSSASVSASSSSFPFMSSSSAAPLSSNVASAPNNTANMNVNINPNVSTLSSTSLPSSSLSSSSASSSSSSSAAFPVQPVYGAQSSSPSPSSTQYPSLASQANAFVPPSFAPSSSSSAPAPLPVSSLPPGTLHITPLPSPGQSSTSTFAASERLIKHGLTAIRFDDADTAIAKIKDALGLLLPLATKPY